jgi:hypothetical protein
MISGQNDGTSSTLTVDAAAAAIDRLFSEPEEKETEKAKPESQKTPEPPVEGADDDTDEEVEGSDETEQEDPENVEVDEEVDEEELPKPRVFKVKVADEEVEVPEEELVRGYSRTADYTRKTQALAEERKTFQAEATRIRETAQRYESGLAELETVLRTAAPSEPDWATLKQGDPAVFAAEWASWQQHQEALRNVEAERKAVLEHLQSEAANLRKEQLRAEAEHLVAAIPEWKDPEVAKKDKAKLVAHAKSRGFTEEDLAQVADHRIIKLLRDAMLYGESQDASKQKRSLGEAADREGEDRPAGTGQPDTSGRDRDHEAQAAAREDWSRRRRGRSDRELAGLGERLLSSET